MMIQEYRASRILFNFLVSNYFPGVFLIPANTCPIVPLVFIKSGTKFEFVDISPDDYCMDKRIILDKIRKDQGKYSGILFIRSYGMENDEDEFFRQARSSCENLIIIDDSCLCRPDPDYLCDGPVDLKLFSTGYAKYVDLGMGAFAFMNDKTGLKYLQLFEDYCEDDYHSVMSEINESVRNNKPFSYKAEKLWLTNRSLPDDYIEKVREGLARATQHKSILNSVYGKNLPSVIIMDDKYQNWRFNIIVDPPIKEKILKALFESNLFAGSHFSSLSHIFGQKRSPVADEVKSQIINLFNDRYYSEEQALKTCDVINNHFGLH
jgi:hypothetical protein